MNCLLSRTLEPPLAIVKNTVNHFQGPEASAQQFDLPKATVFERVTIELILAANKRLTLKMHYVTSSSHGLWSSPALCCRRAHPRPTMRYNGYPTVRTVSLSRAPSRQEVDRVGG